MTMSLRRKLLRTFDMASPIIQFILDFVALAIVWLPVLLFFLIGDPYKRGFYCFDESLNYPFKDSTISSLVLFLVGVFLPVLSVSFTCYTLVFLNLTKYGVNLVS